MSDYLPLATLIAEKRRSASLSLSEVAQRMRKAARAESEYCGADRKAIHDYEQGRIPHPDGLRWLAAALELPIDRLVAASRRQRMNLRGEAGREDARALPDRDLEPGHEMVRMRLEASLSYHPRFAATLEALSALCRADLDGHDGPTCAPFSVGALVGASRDWLRDHAHRSPTDRPATADGTVPTEVIRDVFSTFQGLDTKHGGGHGRLALVQYLSSYVLPLFETSSTPGRSLDADPELCAATGEMLYLAGLTAFDTAALGLAERYFIQALRLSEEAGNTAFAANVIGGMSHLAIFARCGEQAVNLARTGLAGAREEAIPSLSMRLHVMEARGHALLGDSPACAAAMSRAEEALGEAGRGRDLHWTRFLDVAFLAGEMSQCFRDLNQPKSGERAAQESIEASGERGRRRMLSQATLAVSYLQQGDVEHSCAAGTRALELIESGVRSSRAIHEIRSLQGWLYGHRSERGVRAFNEQVRELLG